MATHTGFTFTLKDKNTSIPDKLKLAKFAWATETVHIPNKHQYLLDFVSGLLVNRKKHQLSREDITLIWKALEKLLSQSGPSAILKPSILLAVTDDLAWFLEQDRLEKKSHKEFIVSVVNCAQQLLGFSSIVTSQFENLCLLLPPVCNLILAEDLTSKTVNTQIQHLLDTLVTVLGRVQKSHLNQSQVLQIVTDKVMRVALKLLDRPSNQNLQSFLLACLLHRDHHEVYAAYLKNVTNEPGQGHAKQALKTVANVFTGLISAVLSENESVAARSFLGAFIKAFIQNDKPEPRLCFLLLKHLVKLLTPIKGDKSSARQSINDNLWIHAVTECVAACEGCDLFSTSTKNNDVIKWFFQLTEMMLEKNRTCSWFIYMRAVLGFNHLVVEKYWQRILNCGLTTADQIPEESFEEQDKFLSALVTTYMKLRRSPDLLKAILSSVEESVCGMDVYGHLPQFHNRLCSMFKEAPPASVLDMWEGLQAACVKQVNFLNASGITDPSSVLPRLQWVLSLYAVLLNNACLFDHRVASVLRQKVQVFVGNLEQDVLLQIQRQKEVIKQCPAWNDVLSAWTMVKMLLYPKWRETDAAAGGSNKVDEQSESQGCNKLYKRAEPVCRARLAALRTNLVSAENAMSEDDVAQGQSTVEAIATDLLKLPSLTRESVFKVWDVQTSDLTATHLPLHHFQQFSQIFPLMGRHISESLIDVCVTFLLNVLSLASSEDINRIPTGETTLLSEVLQFLVHPATREVRGLQDKLSSAIWQLLLQGLADQAHSPRKKKKKMEKKADGKDGESDLATILHILTEVESGDVKCSLHLLDVKRCLRAQPYFPVLIYVLRQQDVDYLPTVSLRCQIGTLLLLAALELSDDEGEVEVDTVHLLIQSLSMSRSSKLFEYMDPTELIDFVMTVCSTKQEVRSKLLEVTIQAVMNDREAVSRMTVFVKKLTDDLYEKPGDVIKMRAVAYIVKYCRKYVTKSHHSPKTREAALEIFFSLAKFLVKHGMEWSESASLADRSPMKLREEGGLKQSPLKKKKVKGKRQREDDNESGMKPLQSLSDSVTADSYNLPWIALLDSVCEVLDLWTKDVVDDKFNEHLAQMVSQIVKRVTADLKSHSVHIKTKEAELKFLEACCHCQLRCNSDNSDSAVTAAAEGDDDISDSEQPQTQTTKLSKSISSSASSSACASLCLLTEADLEEIWTLCYDLCVQEFSRKLQEFHTPNGVCSNHSQRTDALFPDNFTIDVGKNLKEAQNSTGDGKSQSISAEQKGLNRPCNFVIWQPDDMDTWPPSVTACLDVLTAILENSSMNMFGAMLNRMLSPLVPVGQVEPSVVFVVVSVWRRILMSPHIPHLLVKELFKHMYQLLSVVLNTVQHFSNLISCPKTSPRSPSAVETETASPLLSESSEILPLMHIASRFILDALSDFVDLGKTMITPRMTLLCLHAATTFTLTCPRDLHAVYRLLNTLLIHHTNTALTAVPTVLKLVNKLISACIALGSEDKVSEQGGQLQELLDSAQLITRLLTLLSSPAYKTDLAKVAYTVLGEYVIGAQKGRLHTAVKRELVRGMYRILSICDKYRLAALNASLPPGVKDTFKFLHQDYEKYYRYSGTV